MSELLLKGMSFVDFGYGVHREWVHLVHIDGSLTQVTTTDHEFLDFRDVETTPAKRVPHKGMRGVVIYRSPDDWGEFFRAGGGMTADGRLTFASSDGVFVCEEDINVESLRKPVKYRPWYAHYSHWDKCWFQKHYGEVAMHGGLKCIGEIGCFAEGFDTPEAASNDAIFQCEEHWRREQFEKFERDRDLPLVTRYTLRGECIRSDYPQNTYGAGDHMIAQVFTPEAALRLKEELVGKSFQWYTGRGYYYPVRIETVRVSAEEVFKRDPADCKPWVVGL